MVNKDLQNTLSVDDGKVENYPRSISGSVSSPKSNQLI